MAKLTEMKKERNKRLLADFNAMSANGDTKGVVMALAQKYGLCTMQVYRIIWKGE